MIAIACTKTTYACLWIGADTMVEFSYAEALEMLQSQLKQSHEKIQELDEDLFFLRGNSITAEVNMARLFNYNLKMKKLREAEAIVAKELEAK